jgi:hypothetical protein
MKDDDERPSMKTTLGLVVDNDPRSKSTRGSMEELDRLSKALTGEGLSMQSFGQGEYDKDGDDEPLLEEAVLTIVSKPSQVPDYHESDVSEDYRFSREMLYTLMTEGGSALAAALRLAKQSQHPRAFEIVNSLTNTMRDLTKDLMVLQKAYNDVTAGKENQKKVAGAGEGQAALPAHEQKMTGTTADIMRLVRQAQGTVIDEQKAN